MDFISPTPDEAYLVIGVVQYSTVFSISFLIFHDHRRLNLYDDLLPDPPIIMRTDPKT
jgi:hypothetical protein